MSRLSSTLAVLLAAGPAAAQVSAPPLPQSRAPAAYDHPGVGMVTVFWGESDYVPESLVFKNPSGMWRIAWMELYRLGWDEEETQTRYNVWSLKNDGMALQGDHRAGCTFWRYDKPEVFEGLGIAMKQLHAKRPKAQAGYERLERTAIGNIRLSAAIRLLDFTQQREKLMPGTVRDVKYFKDVADHIDLGEAYVKAAEEPRGVGMDEAVYLNRALARMDKAEENIEKAEYLLKWLRKED